MKGIPELLYIDSNEPINIVRGLYPTVQSAVTPTNVWGKADYYWVDPRGNERMIERKQIGEALSDIDAVEEQLGRHLHECDELTLLVEGVAIPTARGVQMFTYNSGKEQWLEGYELSHQPKLWSRWMSFKYSLERHAGVHVEEVSHWYATVEYISTAFKKSNDPTNTTLNRYVVPHMPPFHKNPHIDNLCRLKSMGMGEKTASTLIAEFTTFYGVMMAPYADLVGVMGGAWTKKFFKAIGREM